MVDPVTAIAGIKAGKEGLGLIKNALELIPNKEKKEQAAAALKNVEIALEITQAEAAQSFGYDLCKRHFPPAPMIETASGKKCEKCGREEIASSTSQKASEKSTTADLEIEILKFFFENPNEELRAEDLARTIKKHPSIVELALKKLYKQHYLRMSLIMGSGAFYSIGPAGTEFLIEQGLVAV